MSTSDRTPARNPTETAQDAALSVLLDKAFPVPELNVPQLSQRLREQIQASHPAKPGSGVRASLLDYWFTNSLRPAMAAMLLLAAGFYLGFYQPSTLQFLLADENSRYEAVGQLAFEDSSTNFYQTYSQAFLRDQGGLEASELQEL